MIVFIFLFIVLFFSYLKSKELFLSQLILIFSSLLLSFLFTIEYSLTDLAFLNSDELVYTFSRGDVFDFEGKSSRLIWYFLNDLVFYYSGVYGWENKFLPMPFLLLFNFILHCSFPNVRNISFAIYLTPYFIFISVMDLRDVLIITMCFLAFFAYVYKKSYLFILSCLFLIFLRPFSLVLIVFPILIILVFSKDVSVLKRLLTVFLISVFSVFIFYIFNDKFNMYFYRISFLIEGGGNETLQGESMSFDPFSLFIYFMKFIFAPLPISLFERVIFEGGHELFGFTDDVIRATGQIVYYCSFLYLVFNFKNFILAFRSNVFSGNEKRMFFLVLCFSIFWVVVYTFFSLGDAHTRVKLVHMLCISIGCLFIYTFKKRLK